MSPGLFFLKNEDQIDKLVKSINIIAQQPKQHFIRQVQTYTVCEVRQQVHLGFI